MSMFDSEAEDAPGPIMCSTLKYVMTDVEDPLKLPFFGYTSGLPMRILIPILHLRALQVAIMSSHSTSCMVHFGNRLAKILRQGCFHQVFFFFQTMTTSDSDSVSEGQEFFNMFYIGISIENILYGESHGTYRLEIVQTWWFALQGSSCSSTSRPYVSC